MNDWIQQYIAAQHRALDSIDPAGVAQAIATVRKAWQEDRQIFALGNGGSAANVSHFATDLGKSSSDAMGRCFRVLSLTDNVAWITALGNDYMYEDVYVRQLHNYARPGDVLIAASVSGSSPNLIKAFRWAAEREMQTIALVGGKRGVLAELAGQTIVVDDVHYGRVEDVQMHILHMICYVFVEQPEEQRAGAQ